MTHRYKNLFNYLQIYFFILPRWSMVKTATKDSKMLTGNSRFGQLGDMILVNWATHMWTINCDPFK